MVKLFYAAVPQEGPELSMPLYFQLENHHDHADKASPLYSLKQLIHLQCHKHRYDL
jgi:hypothetical protein